MKLKIFGFLFVLTFLASCAPDFVKTGRSYPKLSAEAPVKVMLSYQGVKFDEIGLYSSTYSWLGGDQTSLAIDNATGMARRNGGDCIFLKGVTKDTDGNPTYTFVIGRLIKKKESKNEDK